MNYLRAGAQRLGNYIGGLTRPQPQASEANRSQKLAAEYRRRVRKILAELKGVKPGSLQYPRSKEKLQEYETEIQQIRKSNAITNEEFIRLSQIDPNPHYEIVFNRREHIRIGGEITDSNYMADIAIGTPNENDYSALLIGVSTEIQRIIQEERQRLGPIKVRLGIFGTLRRITNFQQGLFDDDFQDDGEYDYRYNIPFKTRNLAILPATNIDDAFNFALMRIMEKVDVYQNYGSGWEFYRVERIFIEITQFQPLAGAGQIPLPNEVSAKKAVVNPNNKDKKCFLWAVLAAIYRLENHPERVSQYRQYENQLNFDGIEFPVQADEVIFRRFERQNPAIALCIMEWRNHRPSPIYVTDKEVAEGRQMIDLLLISDGENQHYCWVKNLSRLVAGRTKNHNKSFICRWCLLHVTQQKEIHDNHLEICRGIKKNPQADRMPTEKNGGNIYKFKNWKRRMQVPYHIVADFEALARVLSKEEINQLKKTHKIEEQEACSYLYVKVRYDGVYEPLKLYVGKNAAQRFITDMTKEALAIRKEYKEPVEMLPLTYQEEREHNNAIKCWVCKKIFSGDKVKDHCHITGKYRGAAHKSCNLALQIKPHQMHIPCMFNNLSGYDSHLIMQGIGAIECQDEIEAIPFNMEKYMAFKLGSLRFIDSQQFIKGSLDKLAANLGAVKCKADPCTNPNHLWKIDDRRCFGRPENFKITKSQAPPEHHDIYFKKGIFPYQYMNSWDKFNETSLPPKEAFYSSLTNTHITDKEYEFAQEVWKRTGCKTLRDYHDIYLKTDVLLLADIFQNFREMAYEKYGLDPLWYYSTPGFAWDALFLMTGQEVELITDQDMYMMVEKGLRGGISMVSRRYAKANNSGMGEGKWNPKKQKSFLLYLDANNLYAWAMLQVLPTGGFEWVTDEQEIRNLQKKIEAGKLSDTALKGYILDVDMKYPKSLHPQHTDYPLAPEKMKVKKEWLSKKQHELIERSGQRYTPTEKLIPNLYDKKRYVVHYRNLQYYLKKGMVITKIHRVIKFDQKAWMKPYIDFNTAMRAKATNDFEKDLFKLMNNAVFGKSMENLRKRQRVSIVQPLTHPKKYKKLTSDPSFKSRKIFSENLVVIYRRKVEVMLNRPTYIGMCVLELSKLCMYQFYYDTLKARYGEKIRLCYTDTDSLLVQIQTEDINADLIDMSDQFDFCDYPMDHPVRQAIGEEKIKANTKIPGLFKDECNGAIIVEFIGLRPKMYSILKAGEEATNPKHGIRKAKGVPSKIVKKEFHHERYRKTLFDPEYRDTVTFCAIRSEKHKLYVVEMTKVGTASMDDKKWIAPDNITMCAHGDCRIPLLEN